MSQEERDREISHRNKFITTESLRKRRETNKRKFDARPWEDLGVDGRKKRVVAEQNNKCNRCKLDEWLGEPLTLEIDHKDGCSDNNARENLEGLCPNCHSLTPTWRGRNKRSNMAGKVSDEDIAAAIRETKNIRQALLFVGLAAKGDNYRRASRIKDSIIEQAG